MSADERRKDGSYQQGGHFQMETWVRPHSLSSTELLMICLLAHLQWSQLERSAHATILIAILIVTLSQAHTHLLR